MIFHQRLDERLNGLVAAEKERLPGTLSMTMDVALSDDAQLHLSLVEVNDLACAAERIVLTTDKLKDAPIERVGQIAQTLAARMNYLWEPLVLLEKDEQEGVFQLRSSPPSGEKQNRSYFELNVRRDRIELARYQKTPGQNRQLMAAAFTREALHRVVADMMEAIG